MYSFEDLINAGVYVEAGVDEDGETLYACDFEKAKEFAPEVYREEVMALDIAILDAVDSGMMEIDWKFDSEGNPTVDYIARV